VVAECVGNVGWPVFVNVYFYLSKYIYMHIYLHVHMRIYICIYICTCIHRLVSEKRVKTTLQEAGLSNSGNCGDEKKDDHGRKKGENKKGDAKSAACCSVVGPDYMQVCMCLCRVCVALVHTNILSSSSRTHV